MQTPLPTLATPSSDKHRIHRCSTPFGQQFRSVTSAAQAWLAPVIAFSTFGPRHSFEQIIQEEPRKAHSTISCAPNGPKPCRNKPFGAVRARTRPIFLATGAAPTIPHETSHRFKTQVCNVSAASNYHVGTSYTHSFTNRLAHLSSLCK